VTPAARGSLRAVTYGVIMEQKRGPKPYTRERKFKTEEELKEFYRQKGLHLARVINSRPPVPRHKIHPAVLPIVKAFFAEMKKQQCTDAMMAERLGMSVRSMQEWRAGRHGPRVYDLDAGFRVLGYELTVKVLHDD